MYKGDSIGRAFLLGTAMCLLVLGCTSRYRHIKVGQQDDMHYRRGPYLAMGTPHSMVIIWRTGRPIRPRVVLITESPDRLDRPFGPVDVHTKRTGGRDGGKGALHSAPPDAVQYEAYVSGLQPATKYYYAVYDGSYRLAGGDEIHHFVTSPPVGSRSPFRFWVLGDSGTGDQNQADVYDAMRRHTATQQRPLDLFIHVGDMAYSSGKDKEFQHRFFEPYGQTLRHLVCWPAMGNHEGGTSDGRTGVGPYYDAYVLPTRGEAGGAASGTEAYYAFDYGNVHFICLNSHDLDRRPTGAMARWLKADLEQTNSDWILAFWHHPPYSKGTHDSDTEGQLVEMREHIMPILESGGVDVVFTGHSHTYERSMLMDGAYGTPTVAEGFILDDGDGDPAGDGAYLKSSGLNPHEGTVQVVAGTGGAGVGRGGTMPVMKQVLIEHGSVIVDVEGDMVTAIMLNADGRQRDLFRIVKRGTVKPVRLAQPRQLPPFVQFHPVNAVATMKELPKPGAAVPVEVLIPSLPEALSATIKWDTAQTAWRMEPASADLQISAGEPTRLRFEAMCNEQLFPPPGATITYHTTQSGDVRGRVRFEIPPYKRAVIAQMAAPPKIDGTISAEERALVSRQSGMIQINGSGPASFPTEFFLGLHENHLYLAVINHEPRVDRLKIVERPFDGEVWEDDCVEVFISLPDSADYFQFIVNAAGQRYDGRQKDSAWNGRWRAATARGSDRWVVEMLISLDMLGRRLSSGDPIRFNLSRNNVLQGEYSQWSHTNRQSNHAPQFFGTAIVADQR